MTTVSKTYTENTNANYKATWVLSATGTDLSPTTSAFTVPHPTLSAKYTYSGKAYASVNVLYSVYINNIYTGQRCSYYRGQQGDLSKMIATTSGSTYTLSSYSNDTTKTLYLSDYFTSSNPTVRTLPITIKDSYAGSTYLSSSNTSNLDGSMWNCYQGGSVVDLGTIGYLTLNAPPTATLGTPSYSSPQYAGLGVYTVDVTTSSARYGGTIQSITLTIGSQTDTKNFSATTVTNQTFTITPFVAGTFTPTITIVDSRGQTTVKSLPQITVGQYSNPSTAFTVIRTDASGLPDDEGAYGVASATFSYTDAIANLLQPSITITDENGQSVTATTTWYETWTSSTGVSSAVNWTNYNPSAPVTLYGLISGSLSPSETYTITIVANDSEGGTSTPITQTLSTGFFTIDFQAGGKEIAFGAPANDNLTNYPNGLFKCEMDAHFVNDVDISGNATLSTGDTEIENPYFNLDTAASSGTTDGDLYAAITALGWGNDVINRKNKLPCTATSTTINGITFTVASDGTITANGTATANAGLQLYTGTNNTFDLANGDYILTGCPTGGGSNTYRIWVDDRNSAGTGNITSKADSGAGANITITQGKCRAYLFITSGQTVSNLVFKPMLRLATDADANYVPYSTAVLNIKKELTKVLDALDALKADYIVETGTANNNWKYTKWSNGTYEAKYDAGFALNAGTAWCGGYYHKTTYGLPLPNFAKSAQLVSAVKADGTLSWLVGLSSESDGWHFYWMNGSSASVSGSNFLNTVITIKGTW